MPDVENLRSTLMMYWYFARTDCPHWFTARGTLAGSTGAQSPQAGPNRCRYRIGLRSWSQTREQASSRHRFHHIDLSPSGHRRLTERETGLLVMAREDPEFNISKVGNAWFCIFCIYMTFMLTYLAYFCIFCAYKCIWMHRRNTYGVTAYFLLFYLHILCIFMHI